MQPIRLALIALLAVLATAATTQAAVTLTYQWTDTAYIRGYTPVPQVNGFDYWFSPEKADASLVGATIRIDKARLITRGTNLGDVVNWDAHVMLDGKDIALPEAQFTLTHVDPYSGYSFNAATQFRCTVGAEVSHNSYTFDLTHDFATHTTAMYPFGVTQVSSASDLLLTDGLHAQLYFWTADNRNSYFKFDGATLEVTATVLSQSETPAVPEPSSLVVWSSLGAVGLGMALWRRRNAT